MTVEILAISEDEAGVVRIQSQRTLDTPRKPIAVNGDVVVLCDHDSETLILNWKTQEQAQLAEKSKCVAGDEIDLHILGRHALKGVQDKPLDVVFAHGSVFVVRACSIYVFEQPRMVLPGEDLNISFPRVFKSFGWVDGVSLALRPSASLCFASSVQPQLTPGPQQGKRPVETHRTVSVHDV